MNSRALKKIDETEPMPLDVFARQPRRGSSRKFSNSLSDKDVCLLAASRTLKIQTQKKAPPNLKSL